MTTTESKAVVHATMPLTAHLAELRNRLLWTMLAIGAGGAVGFALGVPLITLLRAALPSPSRCRASTSRRG